MGGKKMKNITRRNVLTSGAAAGAVFAGPWKYNRVYASATDKPIKIGLTHDGSGLYANIGQAEKRGTIQAIDEVNAKGGLLGRKLEYIWLDAETTPSTASRIAERFISREEVTFLAGSVNSASANAISAVAQRYGTIFHNTNSSSPTEAGKNCHRVKFVWDANATNYANSLVASAAERFGKKWVTITTDYVWGRAATATTKNIGEALGVEFLKDIVVPVGTRDFASILLEIQQLAPDVVSMQVGGEDLKYMRQQVIQMELDKTVKWLGNQLDWADIYGLGQEAAFEVFGTNWYHKLDLPGVADLVQRYQERWPVTRIDVPGNDFYNGYMAMSEMLKVIEETGTTNNIANIKALEGRVMSAASRYQHFDAYIDANTHHVQQTLYVGQRNENPSDETDYFEIIDQREPGTVIDEASTAECSLESYDDTPTYDT